MRTKESIEKSREFFNKARALKKKGKKLYHKAELALKNYDTVLAKEFGLERPAEALDEIYHRWIEAWFEIPYREGYFPRVVKNPKKFMEYLSKTESRWAITEAIKKQQEKMWRDLTKEEKADTANQIIQWFSVMGVRIWSWHFKNITIPVIDANLNRFYMDAIDGLLVYFDQVEEAIQLQRLFWHSDPDMAVGNFLVDMVDKWVIEWKQEEEVAKLLHAMFSKNREHFILANMRQLIYLTTMANPISTISQLEDLSNTAFKYGITDIVKDRSITMEDIGVNVIYKEFEDTTKLQWLTDFIFKKVWLTAIDKFSKETFINWGYRDLVKKAKSKPESKKYLELEKTLSDMFKDPERETEIITDLKNDKLSEDGKFLLFYYLSDFQPISKLEVPYGYLANPNGRIFFTLKTFLLKRIENRRREAIDHMKDWWRIRNNAKALLAEENKLLSTWKGKMTESDYKKYEEQIKKGNSLIYKGIKNLVRMWFMLMLFGIPTDEIKDFMTLRPSSNIWRAIHWEDIQIWDRLLDVALRLPWLSKFAIKQAKREGAWKGLVASMLLPALWFADNITKDIMMIVWNRKLDAIEKLRALHTRQNVSWLGKLYYRWFGQPTMTRWTYNPLLPSGMNPNYYRDVFTGEVVPRKNKDEGWLKKKDTWKLELKKK